MKLAFNYETKLSYTDQKKKETVQVQVRLAHERVRTIIVFFKLHGKAF